MLHHAAAAGAFDLQKAVMESLMAFQRAGGDREGVIRCDVCSKRSFPAPRVQGNVLLCCFV